MTGERARVALTLAGAAMAMALSAACGDDTGASGATGPGGPGSALGGGDGGATSANGGDAGARDGSATGQTNDGGQANDAADLPPPAARGATLPFWEYEAESLKNDGVPIGPSRAFGDIAAESSGRRAVRLEANGQGVELRTEHPANSLVVRYVIPDAPAGGGIDATLGLYVNGTRIQSLALTSRHAWIYRGESDSTTNTPGSGAHHFYDEARILTGEIPVGATVRVQKDAQDTAAYYVVDLLDLEEVPPPLTMPSGALSITDYGATADDGGDDAAAIQKTIDAAKAQGKTVWIPRGTFDSPTTPLLVSGVTVRGAGMWYSTLHGLFAQFKVSGNDNHFSDFAILGEVDARHDDKGENGFDGPAGTGSRLDNVWIEHMKVGWWVGKGAYTGVPTQPLTDGLVIHGARIRNTFADGVNFCNGTSNSTVEQSHFRNTGDDALAAWSPSFDGSADTNDAFRFNTVQTPWRANCFAIYGGKDNKIEDNVCADTVLYPGVLVSSTFSPRPFDGITSVQRNTLTRAGGPMYNQGHGALKLFADGMAVNGVQIRDIRIEDATFSGIHIQGPSLMSGIVFDTVTVTGAGTSGIRVESNAQGGAQADNVVVSGAAGAGLDNAAPSAWSFQKGAGNSGW